MLFEKKHFYTPCVGLSVYVRSLHWGGGGGGVKFCLLGWVNFTLGPISAIRRAPTHKDTIEQGVLRTVLSAYELLRAEITGYDMV